MINNELNNLNDLILTFRFEIEISKKPNEEKTLINLYKPQNLTAEDNQKIENLNVKQKTLHSLVSFEQKTFVDEKVITSIEPNNIYNFVRNHNNFFNLFTFKLFFDVF